MKTLYSESVIRYKGGQKNKIHNMDTTYKKKKKKPLKIQPYIIKLLSLTGTTNHLELHSQVVVEWLPAITLPYNVYTESSGHCYLLIYIFLMQLFDKYFDFKSNI